MAVPKIPLYAIPPFRSTPYDLPAVHGDIEIEVVPMATGTGWRFGLKNHNRWVTPEELDELSQYVDRIVAKHVPELRHLLPVT